MSGRAAPVNEGGLGDPSREASDQKKKKKTKNKKQKKEKKKKEKKEKGRKKHTHTRATGPRKK